jgi:hypothetical protein
MSNVERRMSNVGHHTHRHIQVRPAAQAQQAPNTNTIEYVNVYVDISSEPYVPFNERAKTDDKVIQLIRNLQGLSPVQRDTLIVRYKTAERVLTDRARFYSRAFHWTRGTVTTGSLFVPALLSIQYNTIVNSDAIYWITWFVSLLVGVCNAVISQYKLDKKYYFLHSILEILHSEAWQYLALSGRYSNGMHGYAVASHQNQYIYFFHSLERIMMKQVEEEYYKLSDLHQQHGTRKRTEGTSTIGDDSGSVVIAGEREGEKLDITGMYIPTPANALSTVLEKKEGAHVDGSDSPKNSAASGTGAGTAS